MVFSCQPYSRCRLPGRRPVEHVHAGVDAEKSGQLDAALAEFQKATELDPKLAVAFADLGGVYIEKRDYAAAIPPLKRAVELSPDLEAAHRLLGYALLAQGYATEAIPHLEKAHAEDALGIALLDAGQIAGGRGSSSKSLWRKARMIRSCSITTAGLPACSPNRFLTNSKLASRIPRVPMK